MSYRIGDVEMQGKEPGANVIEVVFGRKPADGGKARIKARRMRMFFGYDPQRDVADDMLLRDADTAPCEMPVG